MADLIDVNIRLTNLEQQFTSFLAGTKTPSEMTGSERKIFENALYPIINGFRARKGANNNNYTAWESGDQVIEIDSANKLYVVGEVVGTPFDPATDLENRSKFDKYMKDEPAL